jgi:sarcosine reductase
MNMKLELADFPVKNVQFSKRTRYHKGVLEIDKEELIALILEDKKIASANLDVAFPNEPTRIVNIRDVVEPRIKVSGSGCVFPGILGPVETVGEGRTHKLSGVAVMASAKYRPTIIDGVMAQTSGLVDMWGPGARVTPFGSIINIVPIFKLIDGVSEQEAHASIQLTEFKVAHRLAETTRNMVPESVEVFELSEVDPSLPRVIYILSIITNSTAPRAYIAFYGWPMRESLPTFIHPNELLDGAITTDACHGGGSRTITWGWMNHPLILQLFREHGKRLNFLGVILQRTFFDTDLGKQVTARTTCQVARLLGAQGAILSQSSTSGGNFVDVMLTMQACERIGVKTVLITPEWGGKEGNELILIFYVPEATAIVSTGSFNHEIKLPAPNKVIGVEDKCELVAYTPTDQPYSPWNEFMPREWSRITGGIDWWGTKNLTCKTY